MATEAGCATVALQDAAAEAAAAAKAVAMHAALQAAAAKVAVVDEDAAPQTALSGTPDSRPMMALGGPARRAMQKAVGCIGAMARAAVTSPALRTATAPRQAGAMPAATLVMVWAMARATRPGTSQVHCPPVSMTLRGSHPHHGRVPHLAKTVPPLRLTPCGSSSSWPWLQLHPTCPTSR